MEREKVATPKPPLDLPLRRYVKRCMQAERHSLPCVFIVIALDLPLPMLLVVGGIAVERPGQMSPRMRIVKLHNIGKGQKGGEVNIFTHVYYKV